MSEKKFYRMSMEADETGLCIFTKVFVSIRETECIHFCVSDYDRKWLFAENGETLFEAAKRKGLKILRIHKSGSRIASASEQSAFDTLIHRKKRQVMHMKRDLAIVSRFLKEVENKSIEAFESDGPIRLIPDTQAFVFDHYRFD